MKLVCNITTPPICTAGIPPCSCISQVLPRFVSFIAGIFLNGVIFLGLTPAVFSIEAPRDHQQAIQALQLEADRQIHYFQKNLTIAEGNARALIGNAELLADRIELETKSQTLYAIGSVRLRRGRQFFQASALRYNLVEKKGELEDVYGVIDLEHFNRDFNENSTKAIEKSPPPDMACPPLLPSIPDWHPEPWSITVWGGQMIDAAFGDTFLFDGEMRPESLLGVGLQKRILRSGPVSIELEADLFGHIAKKQTGGEFNRENNYKDLSPQKFGEGILGIAARLWIQPWLSLGLIEGISYISDQSLYEKTHRKKYTKLLNYLGFEIETTLSSNLSLVGRIHHRSGAFGIYNDVKEGSNAYLLGLRYRWGKESKKSKETPMPPPLGCPNNTSENHEQKSNIQEEHDEIALDKIRIRKEQDSNRNKAISEINQKISSIDFKGNLTIERSIGLPIQPLNSNLIEDNRYRAIKVPQLKKRSGKRLINGTISRWRIQSPKILITANGWEADRMGFSNDPFTPAQTRINAEGVIAIEKTNGDILISSKRNQIIVEDRLNIPIIRRHKIQKEEEIRNRWAIGIDNKDRDGLFIGRNFKPIEIGNNIQLKLQPQIMLQRAYFGTDDIADLLGIKAKLEGSEGKYLFKADVDISSFSSERVFSNSRIWSSFGEKINLKWLGDMETNLFGAYQYRIWNESISKAEIKMAYGAYAEKSGHWESRGINHNYLVRATIGDYIAESFQSDKLTHRSRGNLFGSLTSTFPIWISKKDQFNPEKAYRFSPISINPSLTLNTNINSSISIYNNNNHQGSLSLSGGPTLTLGTFSKPFLDYTQLSIVGGGTVRNGKSPFEFDRIVNFSTIGLGITQQIAGPLLISAGLNFNIDPQSKNYGDLINSNIELRWQRRSYDIGFYFNPYEGMGGVRIRLNNFNFEGTGVPFVPFTSKGNSSIRGSKNNPNQSPSPPIIRSPALKSTPE